MDVRRCHSNCPASWASRLYESVDIAIEALKDSLRQKKATVNEIHRYAMVFRPHLREADFWHDISDFNFCLRFGVSNALSLVSTRQLSADDLGEIRFGRLNRTHTA
jgi:hypothetical protein